MSEFIVKRSGPSAADLRAWGAENGFPAKAETRGRPSKALIEAFNKAHKGFGRYDSKANPAVKTVTVTAKPAKGRTQTAKVSVPEARKALAAQGIAVGKRGRLSQTALAGLVLQAKAK